MIITEEEKIDSAIKFAIESKGRFTYIYSKLYIRSV